MNTTITIKTSKALRDQAKLVADTLGIPLTTVINAYLAQFVREKRFSISMDPAPTRSKLKLWETISVNMDKDGKAPRFKDAKSLIAHLDI